MTEAQYLMLAVAALSGLAWRWNATAAALAFSYFASQACWLITGVCDVGALFMIDLTVVTLIFCKATARCPDEDWLTAREHFRCMIDALTRGDRIVLLIFPLVWVAYVARIGAYEQWYLLWALAMLQFVAAGVDALHEWRKAKAPKSEPDSPSSGLQFALARVGRWST